ncbi:MAG TPA: fructose-bisphosphate aldolase [Micromonosporaceae bacterium]|nr:fructose-bisphosphate aldolase [Micromonosporaceae bacterium]
MPLVPTGSLVSQGKGVCAFNVITLEHAEAIVAGAESAGLPVILQISENAVKFHGGRVGPIAAATAAVARSSTVDCSLHLDHVESVELLHQAPDHGFSSAMFDASKLAYAENVAATRAAVEFAHSQGLWLESELGEVGGKDGAHAPGARTDPAEAVQYVAATGVDALAVAVGSSHAMTSRDAALDHDLIAALRDAVPVPLVLHGSSGVGDDELRRAVLGGLRKVNVGTALNVAFTGEVRRVLAGEEKLVDPRKYLSPARDAMAATVAHFLKLVGH